MSEREKLSHRPFAECGAALKKAIKREPPAPVKPPPAPRRPELEPPPPPDEAVLFRREMAGVEPLEPRGDHVPPPRGALAPPFSSDEAEAMAQLADLVEGRGAFDFTASDEYVEGIAFGLDRRLLKRLRQGLFAVQGHLDLHGKTRVEARAEVERFLLESRQRHWRCILLIHGRGLNSKDQVPVLKESLKVWLAHGRIARSVLAFCSARPVDGGAGALYVLLRK